MICLVIRVKFYRGIIVFCVLVIDAPDECLLVNWFFDELPPPPIALQKCYVVNISFLFSS